MSNTSISPDDINKLSETDKTELRTFVANEQQRANIQTQTHHITQICWTKCVTGNIKNAKLDRSEESCLSNCVERFLDINFLTMKHLNSMRS